MWSNSGEELFYINGNEELISVRIRAGETFTWESQESLFPVIDYETEFSPFPRYDISADDERFLFMQTESGAELILMDNWLSELAL